MRKIVMYMFTTLDGFIAGSNGEFLDYEPSAKEMLFANALFDAADGILFGRTVYEGFVQYWDVLDLADTALPQYDRDFAAIFQAMTRVVFSTTMTDAGNDILIKDNIAVEVMRLKEQPGRDLLLICGPDLLATLVRDHLVDEFILLVRPLALGRGKALFGQLDAPLQLELLSTRLFDTGNVVQHYRAIYDGQPAGSGALCQFLFPLRL